LEGLHKCFDGRKASLLHNTSLPTIDEAIAAMSQKEVRLSLEKADEKVVPAPTFAVTEHREWRETRYCFTCGETGHITEAVDTWGTQGQRAHMAVEADNGTSKDAEVDDAAYGDFDHWDEGNSEKASLATNENDTE
jgi:hypothetical protein